MSRDGWGTFSSSLRVKSHEINSAPHAWGLKEREVHVIETTSSKSTRTMTKSLAFGLSFCGNDYL